MSLAAPSLAIPMPTGLYIFVSTRENLSTRDFRFSVSSFLLRLLLLLIAIYALACGVVNNIDFLTEHIHGW